MYDKCIGVKVEEPKKRDTFLRIMLKEFDENTDTSLTPVQMISSNSQKSH